MQNKSFHLNITYISYDGALQLWKLKAFFSSENGEIWILP